VEQVDMAMRSYFGITHHCRICESDKLVTILELGDQPLANALKKTSTADEEQFPLTLMYCPDCSLVQLRETVDKEILFSNYTWVTGTSPTTRDYAKLFSQRVVEIEKPDVGDLIVEIASNDGTLLLPFIENGYQNVLGIDPAKNIVKIANERGVRTQDKFWSKQVAEETIVEFGQAKVVIARNVIPHVSELQDVISGIQHVLRDDGVGIIEFHDAGQILEELHYDSIYHEHLCYFSIKSISHLLGIYDLFPFHLDISPISGGSYVIYFSKGKRRQSDAYERLQKKESSLCVNEAQAWTEFADLACEHRRKTVDIVESLSSKTILGFGASARSSTYLNFCGFDIDQMIAIIDNNPMKQGMYSPGTAIPIVPFEKGFEMNPDLILILAWNFKDEIVKVCRTRGYKGQFLVPFPHTPYFLNESQ
jgi:SAM-dependent methyltransferase